MIGKSNRIEVTLTADATGFRKAFTTATNQVAKFGRDLDRSLTTVGGRQFDGLRTGYAAVGLAAAAAAATGIYAFTTALSASIAKASEFETAAYNMQSSLTAANRQFQVGTAKEWEDSIKSLSATLKVYSETDLRLAASRTVDMTKRLGLSATQMKKVIEVSGDLGAGKFALVDSVERVTAALRGEAEASEALGLTLNETYVKAWYEANNATGKAWKDLTDLEKAQVRYNILLEQATPSLGRAAGAFDTYSGAMQDTANSFGDLQKEAGLLVTSNTFVIETLHILSQTFQNMREHIKGNRNDMVDLVKRGILLVVDGVAGAVETMRFFYNAWQGLKLVAHGTVTLIVKGLAEMVKLTQFVIGRFDTLLTILAKIGAIDENPLTAMAETLDGFGDYSAEELEKIWKETEQVNSRFDSAKSAVEEFRRKLAEIPAEYKDTSEGMAEPAKEVQTEMVKVGDTWIEVSKDIARQNGLTTNQVEQDWGDVWLQFQRDGIEAADKVDAALDKATADREVTIKVKEVQARRWGGMIHKFATGGQLPGFGGGDRIPALLEAGEFIIRKEAVAKFGSGVFSALNSLRLPDLPRFATGGPVGAVAAGAGSVFNVTVNVAGGSSPRGDDIGRQVVAAIQRMQRRGAR